MDDLIIDAARRAQAYLDGLDERSVVPETEALAALAELDIPMPETSQPAAGVLAQLDRIGSPATVASAGQRYFGFVTGGSLPAAVATNMLAAAWDQNAALEVMSPISAKLEEVCSRWLLDVLNLPPKAAVSFVTGATMANFTALAAARHAVLQKIGWDVEADGLFGAPAITVIVGDEVHVSLLKALSMLGLGRERVVRVPADGQGRMRPDALPEMNGPTIVCIQAGNVNTGAFDPADEICAHAHAAKAWVHVDAAFGLWAAVSPKRAQLVAGVPEADSWATDAHKWLNIPYDSGIAFVRHPEHLRVAMAASAAYLLELGNREPFHFTPESSRRARAVEIWAALNSLGKSGLSDLIDRCCRLSELFAAELSAAGYEILNDVVLNQVLVSFGRDEFTDRVIKAIQREGTLWCGGTRWQGRAAMRISVSSWVTTEVDVRKSVAAIKEIVSHEQH